MPQYYHHWGAPRLQDFFFSNMMVPFKSKITYQFLFQNIWKIYIIMTYKTMYGFYCIYILVVCCEMENLTKLSDIYTKTTFWDSSPVPCTWSPCKVSLTSSQNHCLLQWCKNLKSWYQLDIYQKNNDWNFMVIFLNLRKPTNSTNHAGQRVQYETWYSMYDICSDSAQWCAPAWKSSPPGLPTVSHEHI